LIRSLGNNNVPGKFNSNYYLNPGNHKTFNITHSGISEDYNFDEWKNFVNSDRQSIVTLNKDVEFTKLISNMSDDSLKVLLDLKMDSKDIYGNNIYGSVWIAPWSSEIIRLNSNLKNYPELNIAGRNLDFGSSNSDNNKLVLWYNLIAKDLTDQVSISAPEGFEISLSDGYGFSKTLNLTPDKGYIDQIIYVRFIPNSEKGYYDYIINKSGNVVSKIKVRGSSK
jgi:hypothetical protein